MYDIAIIGGGPGGYVASIKAAQMGKKTCVIEKNKLGGVCLNSGCIPTKSLLHSAEMLKEIKNSMTYGISGIPVEKVNIDMKLVQQRKNLIVNQLVKGVEGLLKTNGVDIIREKASLVNKNTIQTEHGKIQADNIIIATGSTVKKLPILISPDAEVLTSTEMLNLESIPQSVTIIGGGVVGIEFAYFLAVLGVKVTVVEFLDHILPMVDEEITKKVFRLLQKMGVDIYTSAEVISIEKNKVIYETNKKKQIVKTEKILTAVGRVPHTDGLGIETLGIKTNKGAVETDAYLRTNIEGIYAIGDVNGKAMLAHTASMEGVIAVENICGYSRKMNYGQVPSTIYVQPEIACVGLTEKEARQKYDEIKVGRFPVMANGKAKIAGYPEGLVKVITTLPYNEIVGVHIYGIHATDLISEATLALNLECTAEEVSKCIHPHPTISEIIHEACHAAASGKAIHF